MIYRSRLNNGGNSIWKSKLLPFLNGVYSVHQTPGKFTVVPSVAGSLNFCHCPKIKPNIILCALHPWTRGWDKPFAGGQPPQDIFIPVSPEKKQRQMQPPKTCWFLIWDNVRCYVMRGLVCLCVGFVMCGCCGSVYTVLWLRFFLPWLRVFLPWLRFFLPWLRFFRAFLSVVSQMPG